MIVLGLAMIEAILLLKTDPKIIFPLPLYILIFALIFNLGQPFRVKALPEKANSLLSFLVNLITIMLLVQFTGGIESEFYPAYFLIPTLGTYYFGPKGILVGLFIIFFSYGRLWFSLPHRTEITSPSNFLFKLVFLLLGSIPLALLVEREKRHREKLKETYLQLIQSAKLTALGELAAGIAHELDQPLASIKLYLHLILSKPTKRSLLRQDLLIVQEQTQRMNKIIGDIKGFSRQSQFDPSPLNINQPVEDALRFIAKQFELSGIKATKNLSPHLPKVMGDRSQLQQVFLNILINAKDALMGSAKKELSIATRMIENRESGESCIEVTFSDTGCGIPQKIEDKIFNPFFTTKSSGVGLGLSISKGIIEKHDGSIDISSQENKGTTITITLPNNVAQEDSGSTKKIFRREEKEWKISESS